MSWTNSAQHKKSTQSVAVTASPNTVNNGGAATAATAAAAAAAPPAAGGASSGFNKSSSGSSGGGYSHPTKTYTNQQHYQQQQQHYHTNYNNNNNSNNSNNNNSNNSSSNSNSNNNNQPQMRTYGTMKVPSSPVAITAPPLERKISGQQQQQQQQSSSNAATTTTTSTASITATPQQIQQQTSIESHRNSNRMHCLTLALIAICCLGVGFAAAPAAPAANAVANPVAPRSNFYLDLKSIVRSVPHKQIQNLVRAYTLNDAGFQAVIREINTLAAYRLRLQLFNIPEVRQLLNWLSQQLILSGGSLEVFDDLEIEIKLFNKYPHWAQSVNGVAGFEQEFRYVYPLELLRNLLESSAKQNPTFGQFWDRLVALKPVYERFTSLPQATAFVNRLRALGVDVNGLDGIIRYQLGWSNSTIPDYEYQDYLGAG
ncbi:putative uncharacterized protein DDB_G0277255 isoform X4 [Drosophila innubila]|uniref:putative uncharacterized protein DDB_G0277255 isoform X4 n=1 Tax=Drosophila innubila TaxID=198719 RepID=UPI00148C8232|nr:putative uncharacterized protein DDB_G0277255 isoform X4 [Drosophila innubila]